MNKKLDSAKLFILIALCWYFVYAMDQGAWMLEEWHEDAHQSAASLTVLHYLIVRYLV